MTNSRLKFWIQIMIKPIWVHVIAAVVTFSK